MTGVAVFQFPHIPQSGSSLQEQVMQKSVTKEAGRRAGQASITRAAMIRHYRDEISRRRDLSAGQKRRAVQSYAKSLQP